MNASHSTPKLTRSKPAKPYPEFPLFPHATKRWAKKIRGKLHYFGPWDDPDGALAKYLDQKDYLHAGRTPRADPEAFTMKDAANAFLIHKKEKVESKELSPRTWADYKQICGLLVKHFGKTRLVTDIAPDDLARLRNQMSKRWGPHRIGKLVQGTRSVFKFAYKNGLIDKEVRFGEGFERPSKKTLRLHRAKSGPKLFTAEEIHRILERRTHKTQKRDIGVQLRAMVFLGINAAFGNEDCAALPLSAVNLETGWVNYPRPKTGIDRRCPLWPETVAALKEAIAERPEPKKAEYERFVFLTATGRLWSKDTSDNPISKEVAKLLHRLGINGRKGLGFYTLRHTFRTVADESKDQPAVDFVMGHESPHMSSVYRETISDERLRAVVDYVRRWLFPADESAAVIPFAKSAGSA